MITTLAWVASVPLIAAPPVADAYAVSGECTLSGGLEAVDSSCDWTYSDYAAASSSGDGHTWLVVIQPYNGGIQVDELMCIENGEQGWWHDVYMDGQDVGDVCVPEAAAAPSLDELAANAFRELDWPTSQLSIQPVGNETLVNLETVFFTDNDSPSTRTVTLLGRQVEVEAIPAYTWIFGDGARETTASPGHPYPDHDVFHVYAHVRTVEARVDTTYRGRFRVGDGPWRDIDEDLTLQGQPVAIDVLEARPTLVR